MAATPSSVQPDHKGCLKEADQLKAEGNTYFKAGEYPEAIAAYRAALDKLPKRAPEPRDDAIPGIEDNDGFERPHDIASEPTHNPSSKEGEDGGNDNTQSALRESPSSKAPLSLDEMACVKARAVLNANIGACHVKQGDHKLVVEACTEALKDDPTYIKALQRRAASNEALNTWSSLTSAQEDYSTLFQLHETSSPEQRNVSRLLAQLKPRLETAQKRETDEMMGKLKDLGNSLLGTFGMSTDNFKFTPNGEGGYSMNFQQ